MAIAVETLIEAAVDRNKELADAAIKAQQAAMTAATGRIFAPPGFVAAAPALRTAPPVFTPNTDLSTEFTRAYQVLPRRCDRAGRRLGSERDPQWWHWYPDGDRERHMGPRPRPGDD